MTALWLTVAYLGIVLAITLSRAQMRFDYWHQVEFWLLTGLVSGGYLALVLVTVWLTRSGSES